MAERKRKPEPEESFETLYASLEETARKLEQGNLPLEESLGLYESGAAIAERLRAILAAAELRIQNVHLRIAPPEDDEPSPFDDADAFGEDAYE